MKNKPKPMTLDKALEILKKHNEWRTCNKVPSNKPMVEPKRITLAINTVLKHHAA